MKFRYRTFAIHCPVHPSIGLSLVELWFILCVFVSVCSRAGKMRLTGALLRGLSHRWRFRMRWQEKAQYKERTILRPSFVRDSGMSAFILHY